MAVLPVLVGLLPAGRAAADPLSDARAEASQLTAQIASQGNRMSQLAEQYDQATIRSGELDQQVQAVQAQLARNQARVGSLRAKLRREAIQDYMLGGPEGGSASELGALFESSEATLALKRHYLSTIANSDEDTVAQLRTARNQMQATESLLQATDAQAHQAVLTVGAAKHAAAAEAAREQATLDQVNGQIATLVAQQQAAEAAQQAREMSQRIAEEQAAAQQQAAPSSQAAAAPQAPSQEASSKEAAAGGQAPAQANAVAPPPATEAAPAQAAPAQGPPAPSPPPAPAPVASGGGGSGAAAVSAAEAYLGVPYVWGGAGPGGFDCSGLTMVAWGAAGVSLPHSAADQYADIAHISMGDLQPGDLIFYDFGGGIDHVVMYVGGGQIIQAAHTGTVVSIGPMFYSGLVGAGRP